MSLPKRPRQPDVAARITATTAELAVTTFPEAPHQPHIQFVDRTWKQDPAPGSGPNNGPTADDIRLVLDKLPAGDQPWIREVHSPEDLQNLLRWAQQNGVDNPNLYGSPSKGMWKDLPDGTGIGQRFAAGSIGQPVLDIRLPGNNGSFKVHINPRGGVPDIPATVRPAPPEASPVQTPIKPPPVARPPVEPIPKGGGPAPPLAAAGPFPPESVPHPVRPPHTHHGPPVLGKDELPDLDEFTPG